MSGIQKCGWRLVTHAGRGLRDMERLKQALVCALLATLIAVAVSACVFIREAARTVQVLPAVVERQIEKQGAETQAAALRAIAQVRRDAIREIGVTRRDLLARVDVLTATADARLAGLHATVEANLQRANDSIAEVSAVASGARPVLDNAAKITAQVDDTLPLFLDCDHNPNCVFNRYVGVAQGVERMARAWGEQAKPLSESATRIAANTDKTTANIERITRPVHPFWRVVAVLPFVGQLVGPYIAR